MNFIFLLNKKYYIYPFQLAKRRLYFLVFWVKKGIWLNNVCSYIKWCNILLLIWITVAFVGKIRFFSQCWVISFIGMTAGLQAFSLNISAWPLAPLWLNGQFPTAMLQNLVKWLPSRVKAAVGAKEEQLNIDAHVFRCSILRWHI